MKKRKQKTTRRRFPNIDRWMDANKISCAELGAQIGVSDCTICKMLTGQSETRLYIIKGVLDATSMTFEEAFEEADGWN